MSGWQQGQAIARRLLRPNTVRPPSPQHGAGTGQILIVDGLGPGDRFVVLAHEVAHELLHRRTDCELPPVMIRETEAEAVSYVVGKAIGVQGRILTSDYIALYGGGVATLKTSLTRIASTARTILRAIDMILSSTRRRPTPDQPRRPSRSKRKHQFVAARHKAIQWKGKSTPSDTVVDPLTTSSGLCASTR